MFFFYKLKYDFEILQAQKNKYRERAGKKKQILLNDNNNIVNISYLLVFRLKKSWLKEFI